MKPVAPVTKIFTKQWRCSFSRDPPPRAGALRGSPSVVHPSAEGQTPSSPRPFHLDTSSALIEPHLLQQLGEARIGAQRIEIGVDLPVHHVVRARFRRLGELDQRLVEPAKSDEE